MIATQAHTQALFKGLLIHLDDPNEAIQVRSLVRGWDCVWGPCEGEGTMTPHTIGFNGFDFLEKNRRRWQQCWRRRCL